MKTVEVSAAIIIKGGYILVTQRGYGQFKDMWEFPGGKLEPNESAENAIVREIKEELNASIKVEKYLNTIDYDYDTFHLTMHNFVCSLEGEIKLLEHEAMKWVKKEELTSVDFLPADKLILPDLINYLNQY